MCPPIGLLLQPAKAVVAHRRAKGSDERNMTTPGEKDKLGRC